MFLGGASTPTIWLWSGAAAGIVAVLLAVIAAAAPEPRQYIRGAAPVLLVALGAMTVVRLHARERVLAVATAVHSAAAAGTASAGPSGVMLVAVVTGLLSAAAIAYMLWASAAGRRRSS
jgi:hypothetical protein